MVIPLGESEVRQALILLRREHEFDRALGRTVHMVGGILSLCAVAMVAYILGARGIAGFSMHSPGWGRPGMPQYVNEWDKRFPKA